jgi:hypothetical protein
MSDGTKRNTAFGVTGKLPSIRVSRFEQLHPSWLTFIDYCAELQHGQIERLKIQNGLPILAEVIKEKIKFTS